MAAFTEKDKHGAMLIALVVVAFIGIMAGATWLSSEPKPGLDNCVAPVVSKTAILIDRSDPITTQTSDEIVRRALNFVSENVPVNGRIAIFEITNASTTSLIPVFEACKPKSEGNQIYENARMIEKKFAHSFEQPLRAALSRPAVSSAASPVSEALIDISLSDHLRAEHSNLLVFSDLLQHSRNASLYSCTNTATAIAAFREHRAGAKERPEFRNTAITLHVIPREGIGSEVLKCRDGFWVWFFGNDEGPGASLETSYLPGGAPVR